MELNDFIYITRQILVALSARFFLAFNFFMLFNLAKWEFNIATWHLTFYLCNGKNAFVLFFTIAALETRIFIFAVRTVLVHFLPLVYAVLAENCIFTSCTENRRF